MIDRLTGELVESSMAHAVLDVNGVGYYLWLPLSSVEKLPALHSRITLFTYLSVREDALVLYGFVTRTERQLFQMIHEGVKGFGPKLALSVLSSMAIPDFCAAVADQDVKRLSGISGVGKKSAQQLILDLRGKLDVLGVAPRSSSAATVVAASDAASQQAVKDAIAALETLGFKHDDANKAIEQVLSAAPDAANSSSTLIRKALAAINAAK